MLSSIEAISSQQRLQQDEIKQWGPKIITPLGIGYKGLSELVEPFTASPMAGVLIHNIGDYIRFQGQVQKGLGRGALRDYEKMDLGGRTVSEQGPTLTSRIDDAMEAREREVRPLVESSFSLAMDRLKDIRRLDSRIALVLRYCFEVYGRDGIPAQNHDAELSQKAA